jgi:hypothetical protein
MLNPSDRRDFVAYLTAQGDWDEAALQLTHLVNGAEAAGGSHALWLELCDLVSRHPKDMRSVPVEAVLRSGIQRFTDEVGRVWCALAEHFVRLGEFERAREYFLGQFVLGLEDTMEHMMWIGESMIEKDRIRTLGEVVYRTNSLTAEDIRRVANDILKDKKLSLSVVGPLQDDQEKALEALIMGGRRT